MAVRTSNIMQGYKYCSSLTVTLFPTLPAKTFTGLLTLRIKIFITLLVERILSVNYLPDWLKFIGVRHTVFNCSIKMQLQARKTSATFTVCNL